MGLESATFINQLNAANPIGASDPKAQGDDHIRLVKSTIQASFPNIAGAMTLTHSELNGVKIASAPANKIKASGVASAGTNSTNLLHSDCQILIDLTDTYSWTGQHSFSNSLVPISSLRTGVNGLGAAANIVLQTDAKTANDVSLIALRALNSTNNPVDYAYVGATITSPTAGAESGSLDFYTKNAGAGPTRRAGLIASGQYQGVDGTVSLPAFSFSLDPDTGCYRIGSNAIGFASGGFLALQIGSGIVSIGEGFASGDRLKLFNNVARSSSNLEHYFAHGATQLDIYSYDGSVTNLGTVRFRQTQLQLADGTASVPVVSFTSDTNTGLLNRGADRLGMAEGGTAYDIGYRNIPQNSQSANYTAVQADSGKHILHPNGGGAGDVFTIPANGSVAYDIGTVLTFVNRDSNSVSIAITTDTLILAGTTTTGTRTLAQNGVATAIKVEATTWIISGSGLS